MKLNEIQDLIKFVSKSGVNEVELETKEIKIVIKTGKQSGAPVMYQNPTPVITTPTHVVTNAPVHNPSVVVNEAKSTSNPTSNGNGADDSKYLTIKSPMIGTFYRSSGPDKPVFANVGDEVAPGSPVCIIEAMKLFNEIESDIKGKIVKVLVNDATPVEYDQPLFLVDPA